MRHTRTVSRKITSKYARIAKNAMGQRNGGALFLATGFKRTNAVLRRNRDPAGRPCSNTYGAKQENKCLSLDLVLFYISRYIIGLRRVTRTPEREKRVQSGGGALENPAYLQIQDLHSTSCEFAKGFPDIFTVYPLQ